MCAQAPTLDNLETCYYWMEPWGDSGGCDHQLYQTTSRIPVNFHLQPDEGHNLRQQLGKYDFKCFPGKNYEIGVFVCFLY